MVERVTDRTTAGPREFVRSSRMGCFIVLGIALGVLLYLELTERAHGVERRVTTEPRSGEPDRGSVHLLEAPRTMRAPQEAAEGRISIAGSAVKTAVPDLTPKFVVEPRVEGGVDRFFSGQVVDDRGRPIEGFSIGLKRLGLSPLLRSDFVVLDLCEPPPSRSALSSGLRHVQEFSSMDGRYGYRVPVSEQGRRIGLVVTVDTGQGQDGCLESRPFPLDELSGGTQVQLRVARGAAVTGTVSGAAGRPAAGCSVMLLYHGLAMEPRMPGAGEGRFTPLMHQARWQDVAQANDGGAFRFEGLPAGSYEVKASTKSGASLAQFLRIEAGEIQAVPELALLGVGSISFAKMAANGSQVRMDDVYFWPLSGRSHNLKFCPRDEARPGAVQRSTGALAEGPYRVRWWKGHGQGHGRVDVIVHPGLETQVRISRTSGITIDFVAR